MANAKLAFELGLIDIIVLTTIKTYLRRCHIIYLDDTKNESALYNLYKQIICI